MSTYLQRLNQNKRRYPFRRWRLMWFLGMFQYTGRNCRAARVIFDELLQRLYEIGEDAPENEKVNLFASAILTLNELNADTGDALIETGEREDLYLLFSHIATSAGIDYSQFELGDITAQWREW